jgi:hypothetical protein
MHYGGYQSVRRVLSFRFLPKDLKEHRKSLTTKDTKEHKGICKYCRSVSERYRIARKKSAGYSPTKIVGIPRFARD